MTTTGRARRRWGAGERERGEEAGIKNAGKIRHEKETGEREQDGSKMQPLIHRVAMTTHLYCVMLCVLQRRH